jgi:hypothetical protein
MIRSLATDGRDGSQLRPVWRCRGGAKWANRKGANGKSGRFCNSQGLDGSHEESVYAWRGADDAFVFVEAAAV